MLPQGQNEWNSRTRGLGGRIVRAVALDVCVLIVLELIIRAAFPVYGRMWSDRDFTQGVPKAGRGYDRGDTLLRKPKSGDVRRVAFFGDSVTFGFGLPADKTISSQAEQALNASDESVRWECVNMAGQGTSPIISLLNVRKDIDAWDVDALVYQFNLSDVGERPGLANEQLLAEWLAAKNKQQPLRWWKWYQKSALYNFVVRESDTVNYGVGGRKIDLKHWRKSPYWKQLAARFDTQEVQAGWNRQFSALADIRSLCKRHGIAFMVIVLPYQFDMNDGFPDNFWALDRSQFEVDPYKKFEEMAERRGLKHRQYLEPLRTARQDMLNGKRDSFAVYFPHDVGHLTEEGVGILAPHLVRDIRDLLD